MIRIRYIEHMIVYIRYVIKSTYFFVIKYLGISPYDIKYVMIIVIGKRLVENQKTKSTLFEP